jgi:transcriptional regulator with XRE-family HTH domain
MNQSISHSSSNNKNRNLKEIFLSDPNLFGEIIDASVCNDIAFELYKLRKHSGMTQKQLADKLSLKQSHISRWETPGYQGYKVKILSKLVRALGGQLKITINPTPPTFSHNLRFEDLILVDQDKLNIKRSSRVETITQGYVYANL